MLIFNALKAPFFLFIWNVLPQNIISFEITQLKPSSALLFLCLFILCFSRENHTLLTKALWLIQDFFTLQQFLEQFITVVRSYVDFMQHILKIWNTVIFYLNNPPTLTDFTPIICCCFTLIVSLALVIALLKIFEDSSWLLYPYFLIHFLPNFLIPDLTATLIRTKHCDFNFCYFFLFSTHPR